MCRYGIEKSYKQHFACFDCRLGFKAQTSTARCLTCSKEAVIMGLDFRPPRQTNVQQWRKVELLALNGYKFRSCGCTGPGYRPETLGGAKRFVAKREYTRLY